MKEQLPERVRRAIALGQDMPHEAVVRTFHDPVRPAVKDPRGDGRTRTRLEEEWALELELRRRAGDVLMYREQGVGFRLAQRTWYRPDFLVVLAGGAVEVHEVKGHWEDDARVKWKVAAETFPCFTFRAITRCGRGAAATWREEVAPRPSEAVWRASLPGSPR